MFQQTPPSNAPSEPKKPPQTVSTQSAINVNVGSAHVWEPSITRRTEMDPPSPSMFHSQLRLPTKARVLEGL